MIRSLKIKAEQQQKSKRKILRTADEQSNRPG